jgi:hypothetical protein
VTTPWHADTGQIAAFIGALFRYAEEDTYISLRAFDQFRRDVPPKFVVGLRVNGSTDNLIREATIQAENAAQSSDPVVFCPPIATFHDSYKADTSSLANGLSLSIELDDTDPDEARLRLESILGPVTVMVRSGSDWVDPETGEIKPKIHLHWRLNEPTAAQEDHARLRHARVLAAMLVGADPTAKPVVHPLRWPGSWNLKATPRMADIAILNEAAEIDLASVLERLEAAVEAAGLTKHAEMPGASSTPEARLSDVRSAMAAIPNDDDAGFGYDAWIRMGIAVWRATGGAPEGFEIWDRWSALSDKYEVKETCADAWRRIGASMKGPTPERTVGAGTIFFLAAKAGWVRPFPFNSRPNGHADDSTFEEDDKAEPPRAKILSMRDLDALPPPEWLVRDLIPEKSMIVPFGPPKSGKTFIVLSFCLHITAGKEWFGHAVKQGAVVYIAGEGTGGLSLRLRAMRSKYEIDIDAPLWIVPRAVNFQNPTEVDELIQLVRATVGTLEVAAVVLDTLARAMPGADENSAQEVGLVIAACDRMRDELDCSVIPIHHSGKDVARGARGTSALRGALDTAIEISGTGKRSTMTVVDQKESEAGQRLVFNMEQVSVGIGRSSLVPMIDDTPDDTDDTGSRWTPTGQAGMALQVLKDALAGPESAILPPLAGLPSSDLRGVSHEVWRRGFYEKMPGEPQPKRKLAFYRAVQKLIQYGLVGVRDPWVWLT